jgi:hypothetical protein
MILAQNGVDDKTLDLIKDAYSVDPYYMDPTHSRVTRLQHENGLYYYASRLCIPDDTHICKLLHKDAQEPAYSGHQGIARTLANLSRFAWWPLLSRDVKTYANACLTCEATKDVMYKTELGQSCNSWSWSCAAEALLKSRYETYLGSLTNAERFKLPLSVSRSSFSSHTVVCLIADEMD